MRDASRQLSEMPKMTLSSPGGRTSWHGKIAVSLVSLVLTILGVEMGVRLVAPQPTGFFAYERFARPSRKPGQATELIPGAAHDSYIGVPVRINSFGLRDHEIQQPKPSGTFRILAVGDSVTFGYGVRMEETYLKVLERGLNQRGQEAPGRHYEVINAGIPGTSLLYYYHFLRASAAALDPDFILIGLTLNDIKAYTLRGVLDQGGAPGSLDDGSRVRALNSFLLARSHLYHSVYRTLKGLLYRTGVLDINRVHGYDFIALQGTSTETEQAWGATLDLLTRIVNLARQRGYGIAIVVFPLEVQLGKGPLDLYRRVLGVRLDPAATDGQPQRRFAEHCSGLAVPVVDLLPAFRRYDHNELYLRNRSVSHDPVHPSALGHRVAGEQILQAWNWTAESSRPVPPGAEK